MTDTTQPDRCRLVLIVPAGTARDRIEAALGAGDVASVILTGEGLDDDSFQAFAETVVPLAQEKGIAVVVAGDSRVAGRVQADGLHVDGGKADLADAIDRLQERMMVGAGGVKTRDDALDLGEQRPDYIFFGKFGYDTQPEPHPRNLGLGRWWAEMIEIPCIVMGGADIASAVAVAETGAEFVALSTAVFAEGVDAAGAVAEANRLLDEKAPRFEAAK